MDKHSTKKEIQEKTQQRCKKADLPPAQGNISILRLGPLVPPKAGVNRKAVLKWRKISGLVEEENLKFEAEYTERLNRGKKQKEIHFPLLFGAQGKKNKKVNLKK